MRHPVRLAEAVPSKLSAERPFLESRKSRITRLGLPIGLSLFVLFTFALAKGELGMPILIFAVPMMLIIVQAAAMATLTANRVWLSHSGLSAETPLGHRDIPWSAISGLEFVDRTL